MLGQWCATNHFETRRFRNECCVKDEGRPLEVWLQDSASNHIELLLLRAKVVSIDGKGDIKVVRYGLERRMKVNRSMTRREAINQTSKPSGVVGSGQVQKLPVYCLNGVRRRGGVSLIQAFMWNVGTCRFAAKGRIQVGSTDENASTDTKHRGGAICSSDETYESTWSKGVALYGRTRVSTHLGRSI